MARVDRTDWLGYKQQYMKILAVSDVVLDALYSPIVRQRFPDVDLVIGCGDMPYYYLEYILNALDKPAFFVRGNHARVVEYSEHGERTEPHGALNLHRRHYNYRGLLLAGIEGCLRYRPAPFQYTQGEMWRHVLALTPGMILNKLRHGRFLDVLVTHAPAWGVNDQLDLPHRGIKAFLWLAHVFQPTVFLHGHIHIYTPNQAREADIGSVRVINAYGYREVSLTPGPERNSKWVLTA